MLPEPLLCQTLPVAQDRPPNPPCVTWADQTPQSPLLGQLHLPDSSAFGVCRVALTSPAPRASPLGRRLALRRARHAALHWESTDLSSAPQKLCFPPWHVCHADTAPLVPFAPGGPCSWGLCFPGFRYLFFPTTIWAASRSHQAQT